MSTVTAAVAADDLLSEIRLLLARHSGAESLDELCELADELTTTLRRVRGRITRLTKAAAPSEPPAAPVAPREPETAPVVQPQQPQPTPTSPAGNEPPSERNAHRPVTEVTREPTKERTPPVTYPQQSGYPQQAGYPQQPIAPQPAAPKSAKKWPWVVAIITAFFMGFFIGLGAGAAGSGTADGTPPGSTSNGETAPEGSEVADSEPEPELPKPADFKIRVKILEKQCFGSAGCLVTYQIDPTYEGTAETPDDRTISVIYEVRGGEDGPQINTFTITGDTAEFDAEESISTTSSSQKLTAKATEVYWD